MDDTFSSFILGFILSLNTSSFHSPSFSSSSFRLIHRGFAKHRVMVENTSKTTRKFFENTIILLRQLQYKRDILQNVLLFTVHHNERLHVLPDFYRASYLSSGSLADVFSDKLKYQFISCFVVVESKDYV